jgi:hypothetical protein
MQKHLTLPRSRPCPGKNGFVLIQNWTPTYVGVTGCLQDRSPTHSAFDRELEILAS